MPHRIKPSTVVVAHRLMGSMSVVNFIAVTPPYALLSFLGLKMNSWDEFLFFHELNAPQILE